MATFLSNVLFLSVTGLILLRSVSVKSNPLHRGFKLVNTTAGTIQGTRDFVITFNKTSDLFIFRGIPYAEPPLGQLRFRKPKKKARFKRIFNATQYGSSCLQNSVHFSSMLAQPDPLFSTKMAEDCLFLNIYAPVNSSNSKAVMVYIHGGGWTVGAGLIYNGAVLAVLGDVIVVTLNYRIGALGFLSTGDRTVPGNAGLFDQLLALQWVKENIRAFGGDVTRITLFGQSAGAINVALHAISPLSTGKNIFQRIIAQSGAAIFKTPAAPQLVRNPGQYAKILGAKLKCNFTEPESMVKMVECMRRKNASDIFKEGEDMIFSAPRNLLNIEFVWGPVIDGEIVKDPAEFRKSGWQSAKYRNLDVMFGVNSNDGEFRMPVFMLYSVMNNIGVKFPNLGIPSASFRDKILPNFFLDYPRKESIVKATMQEYAAGLSDSQPDLIRRRDAFIEMTGDMMFVAPSIESLRLHDKGGGTGKAFLYRFDHDNPLNRKQYGGGKAKHGAELMYLFGQVALADTFPLINVTLPGNFTEVDKSLSKALITYWTNFAKFGDPNGHPNLTTGQTLPKWPEYTIKNQSYLDIGSNSTSILLAPKKDLRSKHVAFWLDYLPFLVQKTCAPSSDKCKKCPSLKGQYIGDLSVTVEQGEAVIVLLAVATAIFGCLLLMLLFACCNVRKALMERKVQ